MYVFIKFIPVFFNYNLLTKGTYLSIQFKQWNELAEPRHELDSPIISTNEESLQVFPLPVVEIPEIDFNKYKKIIITTKVMNPLFHSSQFNKPTIIGTIKTMLTVPRKLLNKSQDLLQIGGGEMISSSHSWNYNENFPNQFDPELDAASTKDDNGDKIISFQFPIIELSNNKSLLISIDENFLKFSPIFANIIAQQLATNLSLFPNEIIVLGASDKIYDSKILTLDSCTLQPPEFITGTCASVIHYLIQLKIVNFKAYLVPSEGPIGFEKLSITSMDELIDLSIQEWVNESNTKIDIKSYRDECHRNWKLDGAAMSTQSGLYI